MINKNFPNYSKEKVPVKVIKGGEMGDNRATRRRIVHIIKRGK